MRPYAVRHRHAAYDLRVADLCGHITGHRLRNEFLAFLRALRPEEKRTAVIPEHSRSHFGTKADVQVGYCEDDHNAELTCVRFNAIWLNRIEAQFGGLRQLILDGADQITHKG